MKKRIILTIFLIFIILTLASCARQSDVPEPKPDESQLPIQTLEEFEIELINLMSQVDLVPYYQKQIAAKKKKEEEEKQGQKEGQNKEFKPVPVTSNDVLLMEILEQEKPDSFRKEEKEIPDDIVFIWHDINEGINKLHQKWNDLEPELEKNRVSAETISQFDNTLNSLTVSSTENKYLETLLKANTLTGYIAEFIQELNDDVLAAIFSIKYHARQIVLDIANNNYQNIDKEIEAIKSAGKTLATELEKENSKELAEKLKISVTDLERALPRKDVNVVKIKASVLIKNITAIQVKLSIRQVN
jgi:hypothetical protein